MRYLILSLVAMCYTLNIAAQQLNIATFNIRQKNNSDVGNLWTDRKDAVTDLIKFHEFDIFGIQEGFIEQLNDMQTNLASYSYIGVGRDDGKQKGEHTAIFYKKDRFTLLNSGTFWLSDTDLTTSNKGWDAALPRICTWGIFKDKKNGKKFIFMNTHFDHIGVIARKESAKLILQKAKEFAKDLPLILTGDFNVNQQDEAYFTLANSNIVKDVYVQTTNKYEPNSSFNGWGKSINKKEKIDHIFTTKPFKVNKYGILTDTYMGKFPSDHFPVFAQIKW